MEISCKSFSWSDTSYALSGVNFHGTAILQTFLLVIVNPQSSLSRDGGRDLAGYIKIRNSESDKKKKPVTTLVNTDNDTDCHFIYLTKFSKIGRMIVWIQRFSDNCENLGSLEFPVGKTQKIVAFLILPDKSLVVESFIIGLHRHSSHVRVYFVYLRKNIEF